MAGIAKDSVAEFKTRVLRFDQRYVEDWNSWLNVLPQNRPEVMGIILRRWQACRPNRMRRTSNESKHAAPFLENLLQAAEPHVETLRTFDIRSIGSFTLDACNALNELWSIFENLSHYGRARGGRAGVVGISKAVLLLTDGRVGPAFDSKVRSHLGVGNIVNSEEWVNALRVASEDIFKFEFANQTTINLSVPEFANLFGGRIYDMALGPGA
ncbi:MAG: hypothetical protein V4488_02755 [Pseudomonadota bacterium]